jgi:pyruvate,water dikinase
VPQDVEWALAGGELFLLQARPITALPAPVAWQAPLPGGWARHFRLGEWLGDPVTPLFEGWLLSRIEERLAANFRAWGGAPPRPPHHVLVNGWYFASLNFAPETPAGLLWLLVRHWLPKLLVQPRRAAVLVPPLAGLGVELCLREWREVVLPRYRELVRAGEARVDRLTPDELVRLVDDLADAAGEYFFSIVCVAGYASKTELPLAAFYRRHLAPRLGGSHQRLLRGLAPAAGRPDRHAVQGLDWVHPTLGERAPALPDADPAAAERHAATVADRRRAEAEARAALAGDAKRLAEFDHLLARAQRFAPIREEQVAAFTLAWPLMRRALLRLGEGLRARGALTAADDVFFLKRDELLGALDAGPAPGALAHAVAEGRRAWERQRRLAPPLVVGEPAPMIRRFIAQAENAFRQGAPPTGGVRGLPASPGRATGPARVIRRPEEFDRLLPGEVLVAPVTTPAWTPLFARAAAVVTDTGSPIAHASLVAREYGIPAVVGCADATVRLADGRTVTVDGNRGVVEVQG